MNSQKSTIGSTLFYGGMVSSCLVAAVTFASIFTYCVYRIGKEEGRKESDARVNNIRPISFDANNDGIDDLILDNGRGFNVFMGEKNGTYSNVEDYLTNNYFKEAGASAEQTIQNREYAAENINKRVIMHLQERRK